MSFSDSRLKLKKHSIQNSHRIGKYKVLTVILDGVGFTDVNSDINKYLDERNEAIMERAAEREAFAVATDALAATVTQDDDGDGVVEASEPIVPALNALAGDDESLDGMTGLTVAL